MAEAKKTALDPARWVDEHGDILYRYALARLRDSAAAEDMVQETFLAAMKAQERFSGRSTERTWLIGILKHKIVDYIRKASRERSYEDPDTARLSEDNVVEEYFDRKGHWKLGPSEWLSNPRKHFEQAEFREVLEKCLSQLQDRLHTVFVLRELEDMEAEEICKMLGITTTNLWVMLYRARARLRACLEKNWFTTPGGGA